MAGLLSHWSGRGRSLAAVLALTVPVSIGLALPASASASTARSAGTTSSTSKTSSTAKPGILPAPPGNGFYTPPSPLPAEPHGDVIWYRSITSPASNASAWEILYLSTTVSGAPTAVSGTVLVPTAAWTGSGPRPLVAYAPGTQGWGDQCAPSNEMAAGDFDEQFAVNNLLNDGWAVVVTDYEGLGTPGAETYNVGIPEGYAVLDSLRAATQLPVAALSASTQMAIEGYSQGGAGGDWAAQLQPSYAPSLDLVGVAAGGTPANLQAVKDNLNGSAFFAFLAGTATGFGAAYPSINLNSQLTPAGQTALAQLGTMCQIQGLATFAFKTIQDYTVGGIDPTTDPAWTAILDANNLGTMKPKVPILEYHGLVDEAIPWQVEVNLHKQWCAMGVTTQLTGYLGEHVLTQIEAQGDVDTWIGNRFAGQPAPSNC